LGRCRPDEARGPRTCRVVTCNHVISQIAGLAPALRHSRRGDRMKHSGSIVSIADGATTFVLAEVGPWQVRHGATVITYRTITTLDTEFAIVACGDAAVNTCAEFVEMPIGPDGVYVNDFVTIDGVHEGTRLIALKITVTEVLPTIDTEPAARR
jgi:hypothetical protein